MSPREGASPCQEFLTGAVSWVFVEAVSVVPTGGPMGPEPSAMGAGRGWPVDGSAALGKTDPVPNEPMG